MIVFGPALELLVLQAQYISIISLQSKTENFRKVPF